MVIIDIEISEGGARHEGKYEVKLYVTSSKQWKHVRQVWWRYGPALGHSGHPITHNSYYYIVNNYPDLFITAPSVQYPRNDRPISKRKAKYKLAANSA